MLTMLNPLRTSWTKCQSLSHHFVWYIKYMTILIWWPIGNLRHRCSKQPPCKIVRARHTPECMPWCLCLLQISPSTKHYLSNILAGHLPALQSRLSAMPCSISMSLPSELKDLYLWPSQGHGPLSSPIAPPSSQPIPPPQSWPYPQSSLDINVCLLFYQYAL